MLVPPSERASFRRHRRSGRTGQAEVSVGVRMRLVFDLAKEFVDLPPAEIERLLESPIHEVRVGAVSIMDKQARRKGTPDARRK